MPLPGPGEIDRKPYIPPPPPPVVARPQPTPIERPITQAIAQAVLPTPHNDPVTMTQALQPPGPIEPPRALIDAVAPPEQPAQGPEQLEPAGPSPGGGSGIKVEINPDIPGVAASGAVGIESLNGNTHYTGSLRVGAQADGAYSVGKGIGVDGNMQAGGIANMEVIAPSDMPLDRLQGINPFDVRSLPPGVQVKVDLAGFTGTEFDAEARYLAASGGVRLEGGATWQAERGADPDTGKISIGTYDANEATLSGGVTHPAASAVDGSAQVGGTSQRRTNELVQQKLDLSNGQLRPTSTERVTTDEYVASGGVIANLGPVKVEIGAGENSALTETKVNADGTRDVKTTLYYDSAAPLTVSRVFNADGSEQADARQYQYTMQADSTNIPFIHGMMGGLMSDADIANGPLRSGDTVVLAYNPGQLQQMQQDFAAADGVNPLNLAISATNGYRVPGLDNDLSFAVGLVRNGPGIRSSTGLSEVLYSVGENRDGRAADNVLSANPGTAWIIRPGQPNVLFQPGGVR